MHYNYCKKIQIYWNFKVKVLESICTHYSCFENMGRFVTLKKAVQNMGCKKQSAKKQSHCYSKRKEASYDLLDNKRHLVLFLPRQKMEAFFISAQAFLLPVQKNPPFRLQQSAPDSYYQNLLWKLGQQSAICLNSLCLLKDYG